LGVGKKNKVPKEKGNPKGTALISAASSRKGKKWKDFEMGRTAKQD